MRHKFIVRLFYILLILLPVLGTLVNGDIPEDQRNALIALYNSTNGDNWDDSSGWKTPPLHTDGFAVPGTEKDWLGITCDDGNTTVLEIDLTGNNLSGNIPPELRGLADLTYLNLSSNALTGPIPSELIDLSKLEVLDLHSNQLTEIPSELGNLSSLFHLYLDNNEIVGNIPASLGNLVNLERFYLHFNPLGGSIPPELGNLGSLKRLYLLQDQLTDPIPPELGNLGNLERLYLHKNQLTGSIPEDLGNLENLERLYLHINQLTGSITPELGKRKLVNLKQFYLRLNEVGGNIPPELGNLTSLVELDLRGNKLTGNIPRELGNLTGLELIYLNSNQLTGEIPPELASLQNLTNNLCDFRWNALYTDNASLKTFLDFKQIGGNWESSQTIAPENIAARPLDSGTIEVSWTPVTNKDYPGGYKVYHSTTHSGLYDDDCEYVPIDGKSESRAQVTGLSENVTNYFVVTTITNDHDFNQNEVESEYSDEVSAIPYEIIISGRVTTNAGEGVADVTLTFSNGEGSAITDADGYYSHAVAPGWSGEVTPSKIDFSFVPASRVYDSVNSDQLDQDYTASSTNPEISGRVTISTDTGIEGLHGVVLTFSNNGGTAVTDAGGYYSHIVDMGWTGTVTPSRQGYTFLPDHQSYEDVSTDQTSQNYVAEAILPVISGRITTLEGGGLSDVELVFSDNGGVTYTDAGGYYNHAVKFHWTGTVTPSKPGYTFTPPGRSYQDVASDQPQQDYRADPISLAISGRVVTPAGQGVPDVNLTASGTGGIVTTTTDTNGNYNFTISYGWTGTVTPSKQWYKFEPVNRAYENLSSDQLNQDYTAIEILPVISGIVTISKDTGIEPFPGVSIIFSPDSGGSETIMTKADGSYEHEVARGWSGTVTPVKQGFHFTPPGQHYTNVTSDRTDQNFAATEDSVILELAARREVEGTVAIKKHYGTIELKLLEIKGAPADYYIISRTSSTGEVKKFEKISGPSLQQPGDIYTYYDRYLEENVQYTYSATAYDSEDNPLGITVGKPI